MKMQDKMALLGAGNVVDISAIARTPSTDGGGSNSSLKTRPAPRSEPAVSLG